MLSNNQATGDVVFDIVANNLTPAGIANARTTMTIGAQAIANATNSRLGTINASVKQVEESFRRMGNTLVGAGGALTGTFTLPLLLGIKSLTTAGTEFETELYRVTSLFADAQHPVETLTKDLKEFAQATAIESQFSGTEVLQTMYIMGQAGYQLKDIYSATNPILELATAQQYDLAETFGIVNSVLKSYNLTAADSEMVVNMLAAAATQFNLSMDDLSNGLKYILPTAKSLDMELSEMLVMLGALTDRGFKGQQAGRIIRDTFSDLIAPVDSSRAILEKYNLELYTNQDAINGATRAYNAARQQLEYMERGTLGSKMELAELSAEITKNNTLISQAKLTDQVTEINALTTANNTLKNTYAMLSGEQKISSAQIAIYKQYVDELGSVMDNTTVEGLVPFHQVIAEIADSGMSAGEIYKIFGKQSGGAIIALTDIYKNNHDYFVEMMGIVETKLAAQEQAAVQMQSTAFQVKKLTEAINQLRYEGYEALAPIIQEINDWLMANEETLKSFVRAIIDSMMPAIQSILGALQDLITWFTGLKGGTQKAILGVITTTAVFLAAIGPILLYIGALSWGIASLISLGRKGLFAADVIMQLTKLMTMNGISSLFMNSSIGQVITNLKSFFKISAIGNATAAKDMEKMVAGFSSVSRASVSSSIAAFESAAGFSATGTAATTAGTGIAGFGASLITVLPWIALVGGALYIFYWAWKNNWGGLRDFTDQVIKDIKDIIAKSNIDKDFEKLNKDMENQVAGLFKTIEGVIEADGDKISGGLGQLVGGWLRQMVDKAQLFYDVGKMLWNFFVMGTMSGKMPDDPTRSMTEMWVEQRKAEGKKISEFDREMLKAFTQGDYTVDSLGKVQKTDQLIARELKNANKTNQSLIDERNRTLNSQYDEYGKMNANFDPFKGFVNATEIDKANESLNNTKNITKDIGMSQEEAAAALDALSKKYGINSKEAADAFNATQIADSIFSELDGIDYENIGSTAGEDFLKGIENAGKIDIDTLFNLAGMNAVGSAIGSDIASKAVAPYSVKDANAAGLSPVNGYLYDRNVINKAVENEKVYDGEMRSLNDIMKDYTPAGVYGNETVGESLPIVDSIAKTGSDYLTDAVAPAVSPSITNITNNNTFNITTNVYPKEAMSSTEINKLGDQITDIVESKLGEKYQSDEVI